MTSRAGRVAGKVAIITGAAMGMGAEHARALAAEGAKVIIGDIRDDLGRAVAMSLPGRAHYVRLDVTDSASWERAVTEAEQTFGPVSVLVNNAGVLDMTPIDKMSEEAYRRVINVNQIGPFLGMKAVVGSMRKAGGGSIINISSIAGIVALKHLASYVSSKFAVRGLSKAASLDLADYNIRVNSVHPGTIATPMTEGAAQPKLQAIKRMGRPEEVSALVLFLASDESSFCTGSEYVVDGGFQNVVGEIVI